MNYDDWLTNAPDPGSGAALPSLAQVFWKAYQTAVRWECVEEFLNQQRQYPCFAELVQQAEAKERVRRCLR